MDSSNQILAECSDEELYFEQNVPYRKHPKNHNIRLWEPNGNDLINLYQQIKQNGYVELEWKCSGRISPSQLLNNDNNDQIINESTINIEQQQNDKNNGQNIMNKKTDNFDFDNEFDNKDGGDGNDDDLTKNSSSIMNNNKSTHRLSLNQNKSNSTIMRTQSIMTTMKTMKTTTNLTKVMQNIKKYQQNDSAATANSSSDQ